MTALMTQLLMQLRDILHDWDAAPLHDRVIAERLTKLAWHGELATVEFWRTAALSDGAVELFTKRFVVDLMISAVRGWARRQVHVWS